MATYEIIWESGEHSLASYDSDEEMISAVKAQHERAKNGEPGGPAGTPASRVAKVLKYDKDPADVEDTLSADVAKAELGGMVDEAADENGVVNLPDLLFIVDNLRSSMVASGPHESNYKAKESKKFEVEAFEGSSK
jgi:hypothetical protein